MATPIFPHLYSKFPLSLANKLIDLDTDNLKIMLLSNYTVGGTQDSAQFVGDVLSAATEASGTGYTAGGKSLGTIVATVTSGTFAISCDNPSWDNSTISAKYGLIYVVAATSPSNSTNPVIGYLDFNGTISTVNAPFTINVPSAGLLTATRAA